ncbi:aminoglycoside 6-adenylyltransferase [Sediminispirochaeta smaragdinae]|uniref:Adenylyltransferase n=1 Tax=Sediminispirochaeta smaragdinae (strain DSM 11293 / JCM 15392 / SEBR 4228) TaxID=573413 RepID=E1R322_SEDSS|nr:aminoglycoside 6-adenylyltransferase [Sediminispirochaeta smaragdinae]ADK81208.1 adenylyltransferase [Sediminispirochaeta smaragdinae DSM 11293]
MTTRTEKEILDLIYNFVEADNRIRVVIMNGSRVNPNIQKDIFQDYDIVCYVTDVEPYKIEKDVVPYFGETIIVEQPNFGPWPPYDADGSYHNYNMQFLDGNRIDLSFFNIEKLDEKCTDSLSIVLIDKDNLCTDLPPVSEKSYFIRKPSKDQFAGCCDAFLFAIGSHIPKTIWRKELPLVKFYIEGWLREPVQLMLSWEIGLKTGFDKSIGAKGKYLQKFLEPEKWGQYLRTYVDSNFYRIWDSLYVFYDIFIQSAIFVAKECNYRFPEDNAAKVLSFLNHVRILSDDAESIY